MIFNQSYDLITRQSHVMADMTDYSPCSDKGFDVSNTSQEEANEISDNTNRGDSKKGTFRNLSSSSLKTLTRVSSSTLELTSFHLQKQVQLMQSGKPCRDFRIEYSSIVAVSSLLYAAVSSVFVFYQRYLWAAGFLTVSICSLFADSLAPRNSFVNRADRFVATTGILVYPIRILILPGEATLNFRWLLLLLLIGCLAVLVWSRTCVNQRQYEIRHSLWHLVSAAALYFLAYKESNSLMDEWFSM